MKRSYVTPKINIEHYELTQAIAACTDIKIGSTGYTCIMNDRDTTNELGSLAIRGYFTSAPNECSIVPEMDKSTDGVCYHTNANSAFNS